MPKGRNVCVSPQLIHNNPSTYNFPDQFDPRRWLRGEGSEPNTYIPFGRGLHKCPGMKLAEYESRITSVLVLKALKLELVNGTLDQALAVDTLQYMSAGYPLIDAKYRQVRFEKRA